MAGLAAAGSARAMGAIVRGFDTRLVFHLKSFTFCFIHELNDRPCKF